MMKILDDDEVSLICPLLKSMSCTKKNRIEMYILLRVSKLGLKQKVQKLARRYRRPLQQKPTVTIVTIVTKKARRIKKKMRIGIPSQMSPRRQETHLHPLLRLHPVAGVDASFSRVI